MRPGHRGRTLYEVDSANHNSGNRLLRTAKKEKEKGLCKNLLIEIKK